MVANNGKTNCNFSKIKTASLHLGSKTIVLIDWVSGENDSSVCEMSGRIRNLSMNWVSEYT